jgi:hypothetical protein
MQVSTPVRIPSESRQAHEGEADQRGARHGALHQESTPLACRRCMVWSCCPACDFPHTEGWAMGIHGWSGSIGDFLAPLVGASLVSVAGWRQGMLLLILSGLGTAPLLWRLLDESQTVITLWLHMR